MTQQKFQEMVASATISFNHIIANGATGSGKTLASLNAVKNLPPNGLIVVNRTPHIQNWKDEMAKQNINLDVPIVCYASLKKYINKHYDQIIYDESHHMFGNKTLQNVNKISADKHLYLSATLDDEHFKWFENKKFVIIDGKLDKFLSSSALPTPKIYVHKYVLDDTVRNKIYVKAVGKDETLVQVSNYSSQLKDYSILKKSKYKGVLHVLCTEHEYYNMLQNELDYQRKEAWYTAEPARLNYINLQQKILGNKRKKFLGDCKLNKAKEILNDFENNNKRYVCFASSIEQADQIGGNVIHSMVESEENLRLIEEFNSGNLSHLVNVDMITEGMNLYSIDSCLDIQLGRTSRKLVQKLGRVLRSALPEFHLILAYKKHNETTVDQKFFEESIIQNNLDKYCIYL